MPEPTTIASKRSGCWAMAGRDSTAARVSIFPAVRVNDMTRWTGGGVTNVKYMLLIYGDEKAYWDVSDADRQKINAGHKEYAEALAAAGVVRAGSQLSPISSSTTVRFTSGKPKTI